MLCSYEISIARCRFRFKFFCVLIIRFSDLQAYLAVDEINSDMRSSINDLLTAGISTGAILQAYASAVESLRLLDKSCVIMHKVCRVIKEYIKSVQPNDF